MREAVKQIMPLVLFFSALWAIDLALQGHAIAVLILVGIAGHAGYFIRGHVTPRQT